MVRGTRRRPSWENCECKSEPIGGFMFRKSPAQITPRRLVSSNIRKSTFLQPLKKNSNSLKDHLDSRAIKVRCWTGSPASRSGRALENDRGDGGRGDKEVVLRVEEVFEVVDRFRGGGRPAGRRCWRRCGKSSHLKRKFTLVLI